VFPNPASDVLTISATSISGYTAVLTNVVGQEVKKITVASTPAMLDVSDVPSGSYILSIVGEEGARVNEKVVVMH
jgi:hypothetical protein